MKWQFLLIILLPCGLLAQNVGINTDSPQAKLDILGMGDGMELLRFSTDRPWVFRQSASGAATRLTLQSTVDSKMFEILSQDSTNRAAVFHSQNVHSNVLLVPDGGEAGIGLEDPLAKLHIAHNSNIGWPNLRITELGYDYARIKLETADEPNTFWDIAGLSDSIPDNGKLNFYYSSPNGSGDRLTIRGSGNVGIGITSPEARLDILGGDWNLDAGNPGDLRIGNAIHNLRIGVATGGGGAGVSRIFASNSLFLGANNATHLTISTAGNVGIGTTSPAEKLHVNGAFRISGLAGTGDRNVVADSQGNLKIGGAAGGGDTDWIETSTHVITSKIARVVTTTGNPPFTTAHYTDIKSGSLNKWTQIGTGNPFAGVLNLQNEHEGDISMVAGGGQVGIGISPTSSKLTISGPDNNGSIAALEIHSPGSNQLLLLDGNEIDAATSLHLNANTGSPIGIGTFTIADGYMLSVAGKVIAEEVRVQLQGSWPDYVFKEDYDLPSLPELESSIKSNGHLPGIPSATQIETEGLDVGNMQKQMMEKIEELTLYILQLNHRMGDLEEQNSELQAKLSKLNNKTLP